MAYKSLSSPQLHPGTPMYKPTPSNLPAESRVSLNYDTSRTHEYGWVSDLSLYTTTYVDASQKQLAGRPDHAVEYPLNTVSTGSGSEDQSALYSRQLPQLPSFSHNSQEVMPPISDNRLPSLDGNLQHQPGWGLVSPPITRSQFSPGYMDREDWGFVVSPSLSSDLPQTPMNQQEFNIVHSPTSRHQTSSSQPKSVKHLTCSYWANNGCRLPDHVCLYSHFDTGRLAEPPVQIQRGRAFSSHHLSLEIGFSF